MVVWVIAIILLSIVLASCIAFSGYQLLTTINLKRKVAEQQKNTGKSSASFETSVASEKSKSEKPSGKSKSEKFSGKSKSEKCSVKKVPAVRKRKSKKKTAKPSPVNSKPTAALKVNQKKPQKPTTPSIMEHFSTKPNPSKGHVVLKDDSPFLIPGTNPKIERPETAITSEEYVAALEKLMEFICDYHDNPEQYAVTADVKPGFIYNRLPTHAPTQGEAFSDILNDFKKIILPGMTHGQHPRYLAEARHRSYVDTIGELFLGAISVPNFIWDASPAAAELEPAMINWIGRALGIPEKFLFKGNTEMSKGGGNFMTSVADSLFTLMLVARCWKTNKIFQSQGEIGPNETYMFSKALRKKYAEHHKIHEKLVVYVSKEAHPCLAKAARLSMLRLHSIPALAEYDFGMAAEDLENQIKKDLENGLIPCCVIATLGTHSVKASDDLKAISIVAKKYDMWLHADASGKSEFWVGPKYREDPNNLKMVNSLTCQLTMQAHHMVISWTDDCNEWKSGFEIYAYYLRQSKKFPFDSRNWGIHLCRRFNAIRVWFTYRLSGLSGIREHSNNLVSLAMLFESLVSSHENTRIFAPRVLNTFSFQYYEPNLSARERSQHTARLALFINETHRFYVKTVRINRSTVIVVTISSDSCTPNDIMTIWNDMKNVIDEYKERQGDPHLLKVGTWSVSTVDSSPVNTVCRFTLHTRKPDEFRSRLIVYLLSSSSLLIFVVENLSNIMFTAQQTYYSFLSPKSVFPMLSLVKETK